MPGLKRDVVAAVRALRRSPGVSLLAIGILAVGIGANTAVFSVVDAVLLRPLPYPDAGRIVRIWATAPERGLDLAEVSDQRFLDVAGRNRSFSAVGAFTADAVDLTGGGDPVRLTAARVSPGVLHVLGVRPAIGRNFTSAEEAPGGPDAVILGNRLWRERFGADRAVVGRSVDIDGTSHAVVGVLPPGLAFPDEGTDVWIPRVASPGFLNRGNVERGSTYLGLVARLKPGVSLEKARADLDRLAATDRRTGFLDEGLGYRLLPLASAETRDARPILLVLLGAVALVLLIACGNVTNLLLVRAVERRREVAVRKALGASRALLARQFLVESILLAAAAAAAGVALAKAALPALVAVAGRERFPRASAASLDLPVLLFASAVAIGTGVIFGLAPALQGAGTDIRSALRDAGRTTRGDVGRRRVRGILVAAEVALAVVLLMGAGLLLRTIRRLEAVDPGFRIDHVAAARVDLPPSRYPAADAIRGFFGRLQESLAALPGVDAVGAVQALPFSSDRQQTLVVAAGGPIPPLSDRPIVSFDTVGFDYFRALGIPLLAGRTFDAHDDAAAPIRIVVNRRFARRFFPGKEAVGGRVLIGRSTNPVEIVGVVGDVRSDGLDAAPREAFYLSALQHAVPTMHFILRGPAPAAILAPLVRARLLALDPDQVLSDFRSMDDVVAEAIGPRRRISALIGVFAGIALALAAVGLFAVMAYSVRQRAAEIGVRIALGAEPRRILANTVGEGIRIAGLGLLVGLAAGAALTRSIAALLYDTRPTDPVTIAGISGFLLAVAALACWVPARRAARTDPMKTLRAE